MLNVGDVMDDVAELIKSVTSAVIEPRFEALAAGDFSYKSPGEVVTIADVEAEQAIRGGLHAIDPATAELVEANRYRFAEVTPGSGCAGVDYPRLVTGVTNLVRPSSPWGRNAVIALGLRTTRGSPPVASVTTSRC